ncbi:hypothetical protein [Longimicrobium sp.]|uniref:hypothetical protein n=1 Tax=Longimicrobium sp. TaxID=2029185 RepID=UPI002E355C92|nr:hypothetical protein [Longimicrobium sp.]HEX6037921.1 hypothetical protein [Longimicrobium sp.]
MTPRPFPGDRAGWLMLALALAAGACGPKAPRTDPPPVPLGSAVLVPANPASTTPTAPRREAIYFVDNRPVPAAEARTYTGERIARMVMTRGPDGGPVTRIYTRPPPDPARTPPEDAGAVRFRPDEAPPIYPARDVQTGAFSMTTREGFSGLVVVDGVVFEREDLQALTPDDIHTMEIIRGSDAVRVYTDPRARNGVINITTMAARR